MTAPGFPVRAVLFDLDGTLVDTADDFVPVVQALRAEDDLPPLEPERIRRSVSNGARALVALALGLSEGDPRFEERRQRLLELYSGILGRHARPYPALRELLGSLDERGIGWGIATNKPSAYTAPLLAALGLSPRPGTVICPDNVERPKPHPESLERICDALDCRPQEAVYVGDHDRDIEAGRRAGAFTVAAAYGYIEEGDSAERWQADWVANSSEALAHWVLTHTADRAGA